MTLTLLLESELVLAGIHTSGECFLENFSHGTDAGGSVSADEEDVFTTAFAALFIVEELLTEVEFNSVLIL